MPAGSVYASLLQAIHGAMSLTLVPASSVYASLHQAIDGAIALAYSAKYVVYICLSPPGYRWCDILGLMSTGSVRASLPGDRWSDGFSLAVAI